VIGVAPVPEPATFDAEVRQPGRIWLDEHPTEDRPRPLWSPYLPHLAEGFGHRCGYTAMHIEEGTLDHYRSCANHRDLTYEWHNYRFISARMNSVKKNADDQVLDPFEVGDDWFEIVLPSLHLVPTDRIPPEARGRATFTLKRLGLRDGAHVMRRREHWYAELRNGGLSLAGLRRHAPLIGRAVDRRLARIDVEAFGEACVHYEMFFRSEMNLPGLRTAAPEVHRAIDVALRAE
jgi:hypothetical protein